VASQTPEGFERFKIITDRNIFDPTRSGRQARPREERRPAAVDSFTLVGTMSYEDRAYAFFDGSRSEFKKVAEIGKGIADYTVEEIFPDGVKLKGNDSSLELKIGAQMRRTDEGWQTTSSPLASLDAQTSVSSSDSGGSGDEESDIIKRLMEQRERELSK
jgi:hypothetical protein